MTGLNSGSRALAVAAFSGLCCALLARGIIIILLAPSAEAAAADMGRRTVPVASGARRGLRLQPFPQLAPEQEEVVVAPGTDDDEEEEEVGNGPLIPLQAVVVGITFFKDPQLSLCTVVYNNERTIHSVNECQESGAGACNLIAPDYKVVRILRDRIFVLHLSSGKEQELALYEQQEKILPPVVAKAAARPAVATNTRGKGSSLSQLMDGVKQMGPNRFEAPPGMRENVLGRLNEVAMEGRWLPYFENGKIAGFKLAQTVPNSAFEKIGLQSGDVIRSVNGYDISSPDKLLDVFTKLRDARDFNVDIMRGGGQKTSLSYTVN